MSIDLFQWLKNKDCFSMYVDKLYAAEITTQDIGKNEIECRYSFIFIFILSGTAKACSFKQWKNLSQDELIVLSPGMSLTLSDFSADYRMECICFDPIFYDTLSASLRVYNQITYLMNRCVLPVIRVKEASCAYLRTVFPLLSEYLQCNHLYQEEIIRHLCDFILLHIAEIMHFNNIEKKDVDSTQIRHVNELFRNFKKLLVENYKNEHGLAFYAEQLSITSTYLSRIVKQITGLTVYQHIAEMIYVEARKQLDTTDTDIKSIADMLGFPDQSSFGRFFRKMMGCSPMQYRKKRYL